MSDSTPTPPGPARVRRVGGGHYLSCPQCPEWVGNTYTGPLVEGRTILERQAEDHNRARHAGAGDHPQRRLLSTERAGSCREAVQVAGDALDLGGLLGADAIYTDATGRHWDGDGREYRAVDVEGDLSYELLPVDGDV